MSQGTKQVKVVTQAVPTPSRGFERTAFFNPDGTPWSPGGGEGGPVTAADITDATTVGRNVLKATDATAARAAIGAGTSSLAIGTTSTTALKGDTALLALGVTGTTAAAGNHVHAASVVTVAASAGIVGANVQAVLADLAARVVALETP